MADLLAAFYKEIPPRFATLQDAREHVGQVFIYFKKLPGLFLRGEGENSKNTVQQENMKTKYKYAELQQENTVAQLYCFSLIAVRD